MTQSYVSKFILIGMFQYVFATSAKSGTSATSIEMPISQLENWLMH